MNIQSAFMSGVQGYQRAADSVTSTSLAINQSRQDVTSVANLQTNSLTNSLTNNMVQLKQAELTGQASVQAIKAADEMLGTVIDIRV